MKQDIRLWSPVIVASLIVPRICQRESRFETNQLFNRMEDIKIKIKNPRTDWQGKALVSLVNLEIIAIMEDQSGYSQLISRQEILKDRIYIEEFDQQIKKDMKFIISIQDLSWDGEIEKSELKINYYLSYMIYAVREQVVDLFAAEELELSPAEQRDELLGMELDRVRDDNERLNRKLFLYEKDLISLKRGIKKAEDRSLALSMELSGTKELADKLQEAITRKDLLLCSYENSRLENRSKVLPMLAMNHEEVNLGKKIKQMFMNSL
ncbi:MAG: hypothetical protein PHF24_00295 [Syntrophomonas sp.]|nr:hypothetical protein [Syntrophomonas sp.]